MSTKMPKVSVVVPVYNTESYLSQCMESIQNQTYKNLEILLIDDGSIDGGGRICDSGAVEDDRVLVIHKSNRGLSSSRQAGIETATGDFLMIVDSDDWLDHSTIKKCLDAVRDISEISCVLFSYMKEFEKGSVCAHVMDGNRVLSAQQVEKQVYRRLFGLAGDELAHPERMENMGTCWGKMYRIELARKGKFFSTEEVGSCEDTLFNIFALSDCGSAVYIDQPLYHYRKTSFSLSAEYRPRLIAQWELLFDIMNQQIIEKNLGLEYLDSLNNRVALSIVGIGNNVLSNSNRSIVSKLFSIRSYLGSPRYKRAINLIDIRFMPFYWRFFMKACENQCSLVVSFALLIMNILRKLEC